MLDFIANINFNIGSLHISLKTKKERQQIGFILFILGVIMMFSLAFNDYLPHIFTDIASKLGVLVAVIGSLILNFDKIRKN